MSLVSRLASADYTEGYDTGFDRGWDIGYAARDEDYKDVIADFEEWVRYIQPNDEDVIIDKLRDLVEEIS